MMTFTERLGCYVLAPRRFPLLLGGVLVVAVIAAVATGGVTNKAAFDKPARGVHTRVPPTSAVTASQPGAGLVLRALPHGQSGTAGATPFTAAPPKSGTGSVVGADAGVPAVALAAYEHAQAVMGSADRGCHLSWAEVAGIGRVESDNGLTWGSAARVTPNGTVVPPIYGPYLDGQDGTEGIAAPGGGWVRAEGPMQFLPSTWAFYAQDGNGDGVKNPQNFYDAALTTGDFLCANGGDLSVTNDLSNAILAYNHSGAYLALVRSWISFYLKAGTSALLAAGDGLLPVGTGSSVTTTTTAPGSGAQSPAVLLANAVQATDSSGFYDFSLTASSSSGTLATATGGVNSLNDTAFLDLTIPGSYALVARVIGQEEYLDLPAPLATAVGASGQWVVATSQVLHALPPPLGKALSMTAYELPWLIGELAAGTGSVHVAQGSTSGSTTYEGALDIGAAPRVPQREANALRQLATVLGSSYMSFQTTVGGLDRVETAQLNDWGIVPGEGRISISLSFGSYGRKVPIVAPQVGSTTTTTTSTTTTTTTIPGRSTTTTTDPTAP
jgi:membrane-bound lytic murein transglycosylase B